MEKSCHKLTKPYVYYFVLVLTTVQMFKICYFGCFKARQTQQFSHTVLAPVSLRPLLLNTKSPLFGQLTHA